MSVTSEVETITYLTADVNFAVVSDRMLMAASSSPSRPCTVISINKRKSTSCNHLLSELVLEIGKHSVSTWPTTKQTRGEAGVVLIRRHHWQSLTAIKHNRLNNLITIQPGIKFAVRSHTLHQNVLHIGLPYSKGHMKSIDK